MNLSCYKLLGQLGAGKDGIAYRAEDFAGGGDSGDERRG